MNKNPHPINLDAKQELLKLSANIKLARKRRKITLQLMSEKCGASISTITRLEAGDPTVAIGTILQILSVLGLVQRISEVIAPENDIAQVMQDIKNIRLKKKTSLKKTFNEQDLSF